MSRKGVMTAIGLPAAADDGEVAAYVARRLGVEAPLSPAAAELLADVVLILDDVLVVRGDYLFDAAEAANSATGALWERWGARRWRAVEAELKLPNLDFALRELLAASLVPRLGEAGLVRLPPGTVPLPLDRERDGP